MSQPLVGAAASVPGGKGSVLSSEEQGQILHLQQVILELAARGADPRVLIDQVCELGEQLLPKAVASVMLLDKARDRLNVYAAPSIPAEGIARLNGLRPGPGSGSCGNAVFREEPQFVGNTLTDPRWEDLRQVAYDFNLGACWSMPIFSAAKRNVIGTFALSNFEPREPSLFHRKLLEISASIIGIVLERDKSQESLRLFQKVYEGSEEGIVITDSRQCILSVNRAFTKVFGYGLEELLGKTPKQMSSGHHDADFYGNMWRSIKAFGHWHGEIWNRRKSGEVFPEWLSISAVHDAAGNTTHYIGIFTDISERKSAEAQIQYLSSHDALTGLTNRALFRDRLAKAVIHAAQGPGKVALLNLDLDNFKILNDSLGHAAGDALLRGVAAKLKVCVAETDILCRQGGDEFLIAMTDVDDTGAISNVVGNILDKVSTPVSLEGRKLSLSCSIGIAVYPDDGDSAELLLQRADAAMYQAKEAGRNTYRYFTEQANRGHSDYLNLAHDLREAVKLGQFVLHYQPQIDLSSGQVFGVEALIRWQHPEQGMIAPGRFIGIAEQTGLIVDIGHWVLEEACRQAAAWQREGLPPLAVAVNVSAVQFRRGDVEWSIRNALEKSGLAPQYLEVELTESVLLHDTEHMLELINRLKAIGLSLSIDDFGTGYSSLAYLKKFRIDRLKIDQSFVRDIATDPNDEAIVRAIVQMARALNLRSIAEGVEDETLVARLRDCQCDEVQGFHYARPLPAAALAQYVRERIAGE